jgi:hypothetical protein
MHRRGVGRGWRRAVRAVGLGGSGPEVCAVVDGGRPAAGPRQSRGPAPCPPSAATAHPGGELQCGAGPIRRRRHERSWPGGAPASRYRSRNVELLRRHRGIGRVHLNCPAFSSSHQRRVRYRYCSVHLPCQNQSTQLQAGLSPGQQPLGDL